MKKDESERNESAWSHSSHGSRQNRMARVTSKLGLLARVFAGFAVVEGCSIGQGVFGARVDAEEEARTIASLTAKRAEKDAREAASREKRWFVRRAGSGAGDDAPPPPPPPPRRRRKRCVECNAAPHVRRVVEDLYLRGVVAPAHFARDVVFEDPAAACVGVGEVTEAFRALRFFAPRAEAPFEIAPLSATSYVVRAEVRYSLPFIGGEEGVVVRSDIIVTTVGDGGDEDSRRIRRAGRRDGGGEDQTRGGAMGGRELARGVPVRFVPQDLRVVLRRRDAVAHPVPAGGGVVVINLLSHSCAR